MIAMSHCLFKKETNQIINKMENSMPNLNFPNFKEEEMQSDDEENTSHTDNEQVLVFV